MACLRQAGQKSKGRTVSRCLINNVNKSKGGYFRPYAKLNWVNQKYINRNLK
ncbi:hypothetical protein [Moraxella lacunata]|uniref:hypothetical protein n=1 Tax=Moraxella lacunata TaxID=477 RepID=UPI003EE1C9B0